MVGLHSTEEDLKVPVANRQFWSSPSSSLSTSKKNWRSGLKRSSSARARLLSFHSQNTELSNLVHNSASRPNSKANMNNWITSLTLNNMSQRWKGREEKRSKRSLVEFTFGQAGSPNGSWEIRSPTKTFSSSPSFQLYTSQQSKRQHQLERAQLVNVATYTSISNSCSHLFWPQLVNKPFRDQFWPLFGHASTVEQVLFR